MFFTTTERARSISPDKVPHSPQSQHSAAGTPRSIQEKAASTPTPTMNPPQAHDVARDDSLQRLTSNPAPTTLEDVEPKKPTTSAAALGRSGTLSWKQRPQSGSLRRPLSMVASSADRARSTSPTKTPEPSSPEPAPSRSSIAASLAAKDPAYFRQTPDRGVGSAAYRRSQEENASDTGSISNKRQLPGMSRESTIEPEISSPPPESVRSTSPGSRGGSTRGSAMLSNRFSTNTSLSGGDTEPTRTRSPLPIFESHKFAPPSEETAESADRSRAMAMSPTQGRISPERERSASPTKGMGGFVQSAMLKRSDSVSKRWSTQTPPALNRQSSTVSNRGSAMTGYGSLSKMDRPTSTLSRDNSIEPSSRPTSSHGNATAPKEVEKERTSRDQFVKPALPYHSRSKSVHSTFSERDKQEDDGDAPSSPSKRWSPTKSSWLESALNKPDSPKPKQAPPAQPAWMAEINRIKQQRSSVDLNKGNSQSSPNDVFGSGRTSPIKDIQLKPATLRRFDASKEDAEPVKFEKPAALRKFETPKKESVPEPANEKLTTPSTKPKPVVSPKPTVERKEEIPKAEEPNNMTTSSVEPAEAVKREPVTDVVDPAPPSPTKVTARFPPVKPKPDTPPKTDFRAGLKSRQPIGDTGKTGQVTEFQNVFGKLRKAETKNYVAPDVLKSNILQGKSALNVTGGPKPTVRRDEFKDSLVRKKSQMLEKAQESGSTLKRSESPSKPAPTPEAIIRRKTLSQPRDAPRPDLSEKAREATPEALSRQKSLREKKPIGDDKAVLPGPVFTAKEPAKTGKLADRFNPALASMLARGPPGSAMNKSSSSADATESSTRPAEQEKTGPAPELQHMTKGRARGPKRRAPAVKQAAPRADDTAQAKSTPTVTAVPLVKPEHVLPSSKPSITDGASEEISVKKTPARQSLNEKPATPVKSPRIASGQFGKITPEPPKKPMSLESERSVSASQEIPKKLPRPESTSSPRTSSPGIPKKPVSLESDRRISGNFDTPQRSPLPQAAREVKPASPLPSPKPGTSRFSRPLPSPPVAESPKPAALKDIPPPIVELTPAKDERSPDRSTFSSVKNASSLWGRQSASSSPSTPKVKAPIKLPTQADEQAAMEGAGLIRSPDPKTTSSPQPRSPMSPIEDKPLPPKPKPAGLGFSLGGLSSYLPARSRESSPQLAPKDAPVSPPVSAGRPQSEPPKTSPLPTKHDGMFADFFDDAPITEGRLPEHIDTVHILKNPPLDLGPGGKIRTLRKQIQEVTGDGKLTPVPIQEEHILFHDSMYLCTHIYGDSKGAKQTDVYLWTGNGVAEPIIEDVQLFARNYAKQNQGRLVLVRQGQESPNFFDALGGIAITRRGARPPAKEFMLCGRRHLGHLAFDEVDYSLKSLCSAFAYLISTADGKVYLWKGRGCSAEELSGARLMGMDLAPTGDFTEIDESAESQDFIKVFPLPAVPTKGPLIPRSADHWRYKATSDKYRVRLYKIEQTQTSGGWGQALQVSSSFFAPLLRRPSWNGQNNAEQRPQTPITPKTPGGVTINVKEIMPFCQRDLEPENVYVLDAFFEMYM